jgi:hypothetical protein
VCNDGDLAFVASWLSCMVLRFAHEIVYLAVIGKIDRLLILFVLILCEFVCAQFPKSVPYICKTYFLSYLT